MELMMKVDLNDLVGAKFSLIIEAMLFIVVEALTHLDKLGYDQSNFDQYDP